MEVVYFNLYINLGELWHKFPHRVNRYSNYDQFLIRVNCIYNLLYPGPSSLLHKELLRVQICDKTDEWSWWVKKKIHQSVASLAVATRRYMGKNIRIRQPCNSIFLCLYIKNFLSQKMYPYFCGGFFGWVFVFVCIVLFVCWFGFFFVWLGFVWLFVCWWWFRDLFAYLFLISLCWV